MPPEERQNGGT